MGFVIKSGNRALHEITARSLLSRTMQPVEMSTNWPASGVGWPTAHIRPTIILLYFLYKKVPPLCNDKLTTFIHTSVLIY